MRLSEAMEKGVLMSLPLTDGNLIDTGHGLRSCALGAAWLGNGGPEDTDPKVIYDQLQEAWPELHKTQVGDRSLIEAIWIRNDVQHWSRERIASWLKRKGY